MRRRPDSTAHQIASREAPTRLADLRVPAGSIAQTFPIAHGKHGETSARGTAITAAATVMGGRRVKRDIKRPPTEQWQTEAWALRDEIGEFRFIGDRQARACSQVDLYIADTTIGGNPKPADDQLAQDLQHVLFGDSAGVEQMMKRAAQHLIYNGDSVLHVAPDGQRLAITARSVSELSGRPGAWKLNDGINGVIDVPDNEIVIRAWTPHPQWYGQADAPARAVLPNARELRGLSKFVTAQVDSRLAGAGLLLLPDGIESLMSQAVDGDDAPSFADELTEYFLTPIEDRGSAAAVVPFMATAPAELIDKIQHMTFATPLDAQASELRDEAIRRIGLGMDSDPSVLLGQAASNHWSAFAVDENEVKFGVEPIVSVICHALTVGLLRPLLEQQGVTDVTHYQVWFDATPLQVRPDRSKDAQALFDKDVLSVDVLRRENGFGDDDAPEKDEASRRDLWKVFERRPDLAEQILPKLGIDIAPEPAKVASAPQLDPPPADNEGEGVAPEPDRSPPIMGDPTA